MSRRDFLIITINNVSLHVVISLVAQGNVEHFPVERVEPVEERHVVVLNVIPFDERRDRRCSTWHWKLNFRVKFSDVEIQPMLEKPKMQFCSLIIESNESLITNCPNASIRNTAPSGWPRFVRLTWTPSEKVFCKIALKSPCGAISTVNAFFGKCLHTSSNRTGFSKLFVWYSADEYWHSSVFHFSKELELHNHFADRFLGFLMIFFNRLNMCGPMSAMYRLW